MPTVQVPAGWIHHHTLPPVCARHESHATQPDQRSFHTRTPWWVYPLALAGLLVAAIVAAAIRTTVSGALPACDQCTRDRRRFVLAAWGAWAATALMLCLAMVAASIALLVLAGVGALGALVWSASWDHFRVTGYVTKDKLWVELKGASYAFANAIHEALRAPLPVPPVIVLAAPTTSLDCGATSPPGAYVSARTILPG